MPPRAVTASAAAAVTSATVAAAAQQQPPARGGAQRAQQRVERLVAAVYQGASVPCDVDANVLAVRREAAAAASRGCHLVVFPELFLSGYAIGQAQLRACARTAEWVAAELGATARELGIAIAIPYPERAEEGVCYNSVVLLGADGGVALSYRKVHLFSDYEQGVFSAGARLGEVAEVRGWRVAILVCFDIEFPEPARVCALEGAEVLIMPTALGAGPCEGPTPLCVVPTRAMENHLFVLYANLVGATVCDELGELSFCGLSAIVARDGTDLARAPAAGGAAGGATLLVATLDPALYEGFVRRNPYLDVRRPELYASIAAARRES
jgi:predicted amidohydrolase